MRRASACNSERTPSKSFVNFSIEVSPVIEDPMNDNFSRCVAQVNRNSSFLSSSRSILQTIKHQRESAKITRLPPKSPMVATYSIMHYNSAKLPSRENTNRRPTLPPSNSQRNLPNKKSLFKPDLENTTPTPLNNLSHLSLNANDITTTSVKTTTDEKGKKVIN